MKTLFLESNTQNLKLIENILVSGGIIAVPTETVYALACDAFNINAINKLFQIKMRCKNKPIPVMIHNVSQIEALSPNFNDICQALADKFWPGPLTFVLEKSPKVPNILVANGNTVAFRLTSNKFLQSIMEDTNLILTATSANFSGDENYSSAKEILKKFNHMVDAVIYSKKMVNYGDKPVSSIVSVTDTEINILREGAIKSREILSVYNKFKFFQNKKNIPIIGLTGPSGSGKSTCREFLENINSYKIIDADKVAQKVSSTSDCLESLRKAFGSEIFTEDGKLKRKTLADIAFSSIKNLQALNHIMFPPIKEIIIDQIKSYSQQDNIEAIIVDAAALFESKLDRYCDKVIALLAPEKVRIQRLLSRDEIPLSSLKYRILIQPDDKFFYEHCDYVINSNITKAKLQDKIFKLIKNIISETQREDKNKHHS